jgi:hypothetical protein
MNQRELAGWIDNLLAMWGWQQKRLLQGGQFVQVQRGEETVKVFFPDGWSKTSTIAKFKDLHDGAGSSTRVLIQFPEEGIHGDALIVSRALVNAPADLRSFAFLHAVVKAPAKLKAQTIGHSVSEYWRQVDRLRFFIAGRVPHETTVGTTPGQKTA